MYELRYESIDQGLFSDTDIDYVYEFNNAFKNDLLDAVDDALHRTPLIASLADTNSPEQKTRTFKDKREYVNNTLLDCTQSCRVEALQLRA